MVLAALALAGQAARHAGLAWRVRRSAVLSGEVLALQGPVRVCSGAAGEPATCTSTGAGGLPAWAGIVLLVVALAGPAAMAIRLVVSGRRLPDQAEPRTFEGVMG